MSDPQRPPGDHPRRAEPLQPDKPGSGRQARSDDDDASRSSPEGLRQTREQENAAVDNAREGYD